MNDFNLFQLLRARPPTERPQPPITLICETCGEFFQCPPYGSRDFFEYDKVLCEDCMEHIGAFEYGGDLARWEEAEKDGGVKLLELMAEEGVVLE